MKILMVTSWSFPHIGGISSHMESLAKGLQALGHKCQIFGSNHLTGIRLTGPTYTINMDTCRWAIGNALRGLEEQKRPDLIHFHDCFSAAALPPTPLTFPAVLTVHGYAAQEAVSAGLITVDSPEYQYILALEQKAYKAAARVLTPDSRIARYIKEQSGRDATVIHNFVDTSQFAPALDKQISRLALGLPPDRTIALCPRRLTAKNGVRYAVEAMAHLASDGLLLVTGDGEQRALLETIIQEHGLNRRVRLLGAKTDMRPYYDAADMVIVPSVNAAGVEEATSIAALESLSCGIPLITTTVGGLGELFSDSKAALTVPQRDARALAAAIDRLAADKQLCRLMGAAGRKQAIANHSHLSATRQVAEIYADLLRSSEWVKPVHQAAPVKQAEPEMAKPGLIRGRPRVYKEVPVPKVQSLIPRERAVPEALHLALLMEESNDPSASEHIFAHVDLLIEAGFHISVLAHSPQSAACSPGAEHIRVPWQCNLAQAIPACDLVVATHHQQVQSCIEAAIAPVLYWILDERGLLAPAGSTLPTAIQQQVTAAPFLAACSARTARLVKKHLDREAHLFPALLDQPPLSQHSNPSNGQKPYILIQGNEKLALDGVERALAAYRLIRRAGHDLDLVWITPEEVSHPVGRVIVQPEPAQRHQLYREASLFLSGASHELFPGPVFEALAAGCPAVCLSTDGVTEFGLDGENLLLAEANQPEFLAEGAIRLLTDPRLQERLRQNGRITVHSFAKEQQLLRFQRLYREMSCFEPIIRCSLTEWEITPGLSPLSESRSLAQLESMLTHTDADIVRAPCVAELFDQHQVARWEVVARRKQITTGNEKRIYLPLRAVQPELPYRRAHANFVSGQIERALQGFTRHFKQSQAQEKPIYARWITLCLLELNRDQEAIQVLHDAIATYPDNTDLLYLYLTVLDLNQSADQAQEALKRLVTVGESAGYDEFFFNLRELAASRFGGEG